MLAVRAWFECANRSASGLNTSQRAVVHSSSAMSPAASARAPKHEMMMRPGVLQIRDGATKKTRLRARQHPQRLRPPVEALPAAQGRF
jgi:hypothetical protein